LSPDTTPTNDKSKAYALGGFEFDLIGLEVNGRYFKGFTQLIDFNRKKLSQSDPDFSTETGNAYGLDISLSKQTKNVYFWGTYSLGYVNRDDGEQAYPASEAMSTTFHWVAWDSVFVGIMVQDSRLLKDTDLLVRGMFRWLTGPGSWHRISADPPAAICRIIIIDMLLAFEIRTQFRIAGSVTMFVRGSLLPFIPVDHYPSYSLTAV
jgi:hypothetical protein